MVSKEPLLRVRAVLPPVISFSSDNEPEFEVHITLEYSQSIIVPLKQSRLWPHHLHSAMTVYNTNTGEREYIGPRVDSPRFPPVPRITMESRGDFLELQPGKTEIIKVPFRPFDEPYEYEKMKDEGMEARMKMVWKFGMQWLKPGGVYELSVENRLKEKYMVGELDAMLSGEHDGSEWKSADGTFEVMAGQNCRFRVEA